MIVPTYCEAENLLELVSRLQKSLSKADLSSEIIIVDDNSPDGTAAMRCELAPAKLHIRRGIRGLSSAVLEGMVLASGEVLVVMDGDLSHPPETVPALVDTILHENSDIVLGSRYVPGAGTDEAWTRSRWCISRIATWLARPLTPACDPMSGFFALRRELYLANASKLRPCGYKIGLELIVKCQCQHIVEIPILFRNRKRGSSKLTLKESLTYIGHLIQLYAYRIKTRNREKPPKEEA